MFESIRHRGFPAGYVFGDTAYLPGAKSDELQGPLLEMGYDLVFDCGKDELGQQTSYDHAVQVVGQWYVDRMPKTLVNAETLYLQARRTTEKEKAQGKAELEARREQREVYRLKPKGIQRPDRSQQYMYPDPESYVPFDEITGEILEPLTKRTVVIPFTLGLKYGQKFVFKTKKWKAWYGLRNTVEGSYSFLKNTQTEDLGNAANRQKRGNTFAFLVATLAVVSPNLRKLLAFIQQIGSEVPLTSKNNKSAFAPHNSKNSVTNLATEEATSNPRRLL